MILIDHISNFEINVLNSFDDNIVIIFIIFIIKSNIVKVIVIIAIIIVSITFSTIS